MVLLEGLDYPSIFGFKTGNGRSLSMDGEIEQVLDTANILGSEREDCRAFLQHLMNIAIPNERADEERRGLPPDAPSPLQARFNAAKADKWQLGHLLGDFWETMFCDQISLLTNDTENYFTKLLQRYKVYGAAHASKYVALEGGERDSRLLPDVAIYRDGFGLIAHVDVRHKLPMRDYPSMALDAHIYDGGVKLFGRSPYFFAVHNYLHDWKYPYDVEEYAAADRDKKDKWSWENKTGDWRAIRIAPQTPIQGRWYSAGTEFVRFDLSLFVTLEEMLEELTVRGEKSENSRKLFGGGRN